MEQREIKAKVNGEYKTILFDTTKLDNKLEDVLYNYDYDWDKLESGQEIEVEMFAGENTYLTLKPSNFSTSRGCGAKTGTCDFDIEIQLYNPLNGNEIIIEDSMSDVEVGEDIYDYYSYYGVRLSDFL